MPSARLSASAGARLAASPLTIEKLAPTGEGLVRTMEGVGLVEGALPGEEVDVEVLRVSRKIWWGRTVAVRASSPARIRGGHADGCPACDWAHMELGAAREARVALFLETMERLGRIPAALFGDVAIEPSPSGYRIRSRFHAEARGERILVGGFAPRTHSVEPLDACEALGPGMRGMLPRLSEALAGGPVPDEIAVLESLDGARRLARVLLPGSLELDVDEVDRLASALAPLFAGLRIVDDAGRLRHASGEELLWLPVGGRAGRDVPARPEAFFQGNRFLVEPLARYVESLAAQVPAGAALDAYGGSGLFASALLSAGHRVTSVEGDAEAVETADLARHRWNAGGSWRIERSPVLEFLSHDPVREDVVVADPPRAGLGIALAEAIAGRARRRILYVSCDPATLARDLAVMRNHGWEIDSSRLFDLFAWTHRVEAVVSLSPRPGA